jgi:hypothetical protein
MMYKNELEFLSRVEKFQDLQNRRVRLTDRQISDLLTAYPTLPPDFIDYLREIGHGSFRECQFDVKAHLFDLEDIGLGAHNELQKGIKFFGDNYSGDFAGFDFEKNNGLVIEFWHEDRTIYETKKFFKQYIREQMLMDDHGNDLRVKK